MLPVFHDFICYVVRKPVRFGVCPESSGFGVKTQQSTPVCRKPDKAFTILRNTCHFICSDRSAVPRYTFIADHLICLRMIPEYSTAHRCHPYIAGFIFENITHISIPELLHFLKNLSFVGRTEDVPAITQPDCSPTIAVKGKHGTFTDTKLCGIERLNLILRNNQVNAPFKVTCANQIIRSEQA